LVAERLRCEFALIRYVPDVVKGEFTNIGVVLRAEGGGAVYARLDPGTVHGCGCRCGTAGVDGV
jgi:hypothetical protein